MTTLGHPGRGRLAEADGACSSLFLLLYPPPPFCRFFTQSIQLCILQRMVQIFRMSIVIGVGRDVALSNRERREGGYQDL